jgi:hypothetical protein
LINWAKKSEESHGFSTNMGTALAVDGFVVEIKSLQLKFWVGTKLCAIKTEKAFRD